MSILIKGMKMPISGRILIVFPSGRVLEVSADATQDIFRETKAVPVLPHGKLIDVDTLEVNDGWLDNQDGTQTHIQFVYANDIINASTIIEAEEE